MMKPLFDIINTNNRVKGGNGDYAYGGLIQIYGGYSEKSIGGKVVVKAGDSGQVNFCNYM